MATWEPVRCIFLRKLAVDLRGGVLKHDFIVCSKHFKVELWTGTRLGTAHEGLSPDTDELLPPWTSSHAQGLPGSLRNCGTKLPGGFREAIVKKGLSLTSVLGTAFHGQRSADVSREGRMPLDELKVDLVCGSLQ